MLTRLLTEEWHTAATGELTAEGFAFRGFHGTYDVVVKLPDGSELKAQAELGPEAREVAVTGVR